MGEIVANMEIQDHVNGVARVDWIADSGMRRDSLIRIPVEAEGYHYNAPGVAKALHTLAAHIDTAARPEGLHLVVSGPEGTDDFDLSICDAGTMPVIHFSVCNGDPCEWSATIVRRTCEALGVTSAWDSKDTEGDDGLTIEQAISLWHTRMGAEDGFMP